MTGLGILWFIIIAILLIGYFALDGFDLGVGVLYPFVAKNQRTKSMMIRAIGPVWDGNEVWLLTAGGALFAAFAPAYATCFSGFYLAIMLVLFGLILRAVAIEFAAERTAPAKFWDFAFFIGSLLPALLFGVAIGNVIAGIPLDAHGDYTGSFFGLLTPFALCCGVLGLVHMLMQGSAWMAAKAPHNDLMHEKFARLRRVFAVIDLAVFALVTVLYFVLVVPNSAVGLGTNGVAIFFAVVFVISTLITLLPNPKQWKYDFVVPIASGLGCAGLVGIFASSLFPYIVPSTIAENSLTIANSASSDVSLTAMTLIAIVGVILVLAYHVYVYRVFAGRLDEADFAGEHGAY